jgi:putative MATE family efflux protein
LTHEEQQFRRMTQTPVDKLILSLGIPTVISTLATNIYNLVDTYFVGTIGTSASGATGVVFGLMAILQAFGFMLGHGSGTNISARLGARKTMEAREFSSTGFWLSILSGSVIMVIGLLFMNPLMRLLGSTKTILPYARTYGFYILIAGPAFTSSCVMNNILRYEGMASYAMIGLTAGGVLNIFGDYLMVRVLGMGIGGAGLSTTISQYISMILLIIPFLTGRVESRLNIRYFTRRWSTVGRILWNGMPSLTRQGLGAVSTIVINGCAGVYGDAALAAMSIVNRITSFLFCIVIGIGQGFQPVSAFNYGAGKYSRVRGGFRFVMKLGMILMAILGAAAFCLAGPFVQLFRDDPEVISIGKVALRLQCCCLWLIPISLYGNMLFQSIGKGGTATYLSSMRSGLVMIPMVVVLTALFRLKGLESAQTVSDVISAMLSLPIILRFYRTDLMAPDTVPESSLPVDS